MLRDALADALKEAMKAKQARKVATLRLILAAIKDRDISARETGEDVDDAAILNLLQKMIRQRRDSIEAYESGGRLELAEQEQEEIGIIETFLPQQMTEAEMQDAVKAILAELEAKNLKDMGKVMSTLRERHAGSMDFGKASAVVKEILS